VTRIEEVNWVTERSKLPIEKQVSSGGVAYRTGEAGPEVALVYVRFGGKERWQLPKGIVDEGETPQETARREVREEAGIEAELLAPIDVIEYWYVGSSRKRRVRFHKFVHFFLFRYVSGDVNNHDREVIETRWVSIDEAESMLAFKNEREMVSRAREMIEAMD
jgi:8-oxo-dGTP pyrophosphatase MutT (NUDIX family)